MFKIKNYKKGQLGSLIVILLFILIVWLIIIGKRDCDNNGDCPEYSYCGSDYSCHQYEIKETVAKHEYFHGYSIAIAALIILDDSSFSSIINSFSFRALREFLLNKLAFSVFSVCSV